MSASAYEQERDRLRRLEVERQAAEVGGLFSPPERLGKTFDEVRDTVRLQTATQRVYALLRDGEWHTIDELRAVGGSSGDRRARDLRDDRYGNLPIEVVRDEMLGDLGVWKTRLNLDRLTQDMLDMADAVVLGRILRRGV